MYTAASPVQAALNGPATIPAVVSGALTSRSGELLAVSETSAGAIAYHALSNPGAALINNGSLVVGPGSGPRATYSGSDLVLSYRTLTGASVIRVDATSLQPSGTATPLSSATSEIALADHAGSGAVGLVWEEGTDAELGIWGSGGDLMTGFDPVNDGQSGTTDLTIAATEGGWVIGFRHLGDGWLSAYDLAGNSNNATRLLATMATRVEVAARGDQLGVAWLEGPTSLKFRLVAADLSGLPRDP